MHNLRKYGNPPYDVAVIHGGPGAPGEMAAVARELSSARGVLEPLQTATSMEGQIQELASVLEDNAILPAILIGWSWGAWLAYLLASREPGYVRKLILIGSAPFEDRYAMHITDTRLSRLDASERETAVSLMARLNDPLARNKNQVLARLGGLISQADSYDPMPHEDEVLECSYEINQKAWGEGNELRGSGRLLQSGGSIRCPVIAIHGDYDPHPHQGVEEPLSRTIADFRFFLIKDCGHRPWLEKGARDDFYHILGDLLQ